MDSSALRFLTASALEAKRKLEQEEKEKTKVKKLKEGMEAAEHEEKMLALNIPLSAAERSAWRQWIGIAPAASSPSSAGKRRKRRTPRPQMLGIMPGMDQKDSVPRDRCRARRRYGSGMCMAGIAGYDAFALCSL